MERSPETLSELLKQSLRKSQGKLKDKSVDPGLIFLDCLFHRTAWVGIVYSLIGGMPLCIVGSTGPVLAFTRALVAIAEAIDVPFLTFNLWVSVWLVVYTSLAGFFDAARVIQLATRFTDEIFGLLIVSIFVMDAIGDPFSHVGILRYFQKDNPFHVSMEGTPGYNYMETALLSTILGFGTPALIFFLRSFKFSSFCCSQLIRTSLHDFAVSFAVVILILIKEYLFPEIQVEQLNVPDQVEPTFKCCDKTCHTYFPDDCPDQEAAFRPRSWFVSFGDLNGKSWVPMMAAGPALLAFALIFLDNGITWHLINQKTNKLQHGVAYNYDLVLNGAFNFINAMLGLPWLVASTVPCLIHLNGLAEKDKEGNIICVQETRLTMLLSHMMLGLSLLALQQLQYLPMPILYGVFLFMGTSVLSTIQFWKRLMMFFQQPSKYASSPWTNHIEPWRVHVYTTIQITFFGLVFLVQNYDLISMGFPLMTLLCIPARIYLLPKFFEGWELLLLDGEQSKIKKWLKKKAKVERQIHLLAINGGSES